MMETIIKIIIVIALLAWISCYKTENQVSVTDEGETGKNVSSVKQARILDLKDEHLHLTAEDRNSYFIDTEGQPFLITGEINYEEEGIYPVLIRYLTKSGRIIEIPKTVMIGDVQFDPADIVSEEKPETIVPKPKQDTAATHEAEEHHEEIGEDVKQSGHYEKRRVLVREAWTEEVLDSPGYWEDILISAPWEEEITYCLIYGQETQDMYLCSQCDYQTADYGQMKEHMAEKGHSYTYASVPVGEQKCLGYDTYVEHHDAVYDSIWHEAVYETVEHPAEYIFEEYWVAD